MLQTIPKGCDRLQHTFHGGICFSKTLNSVKRTALQSPIRIVIPDRIVLPLTSSSYTLTPCVRDGDVVRVGDRLAEDPTAVYPPLHSGLSGSVTVEENQIIVRGDGKQTQGALLPPLNADDTPSELVARMYEAGLVGMGGAGFPTHHKYHNVTAEHLLINACECEPYLACDGRLILEQPDTVREGITALAKAGNVPFNHIYLCAESSTVAHGLHNITTGTPWRVILLPARYPQGSERQLIQAVLRREIPADSYPTDHGILVSNVATATAMADALRGLPLTHRVVTVSGTVKTPCNILAPIGTPIRTLLCEAEPQIAGRRANVILGGAMTGIRAENLDNGLPKTCGGVLVLPADNHPETSCIRCAACVRACPSGLMPFLIERSWLLRREDVCRTLRADACIACGCCSRVCPASRQLALRVRLARDEVKRKGANV